MVSGSWCEAKTPASRDGSNSDDSAENIAEAVTDILHKAITRPVVTVSHAEIMMLAYRAGFIAETDVRDGVRHDRLSVRNIEIFSEVERLVDLTIRHVLEQVGKATALREKP